VRRLSFLVAVLMVEFACSSGGALKPVTSAGASPAVPRAIVNQIKDTWTGAKVLTTGPDGPACAGQTAEQAAPSMAGDFNGDGSMDLAVRVQRADGVHIVAALFETFNYKLTDVASDAGSSQFSMRKRGSTYRQPDSVVDHYFGADTLVLTPCGQLPTAYIWDGNSFQAQRIEP
jgi:hypothetical protein